MQIVQRRDWRRPQCNQRETIPFVQNDLRQWLFIFILLYICCLDSWLTSGQAYLQYYSDPHCTVPRVAAWPTCTSRDVAVCSADATPYLGFDDAGYYTGADTYYYKSICTHSFDSGYEIQGDTIAQK